MRIELHKDACAAEKAANIAARTAEIRRVVALTDDPAIKRWLERFVHFLPHRQKKGRASKGAIEAGKRAKLASQARTRESADRYRFWTDAEIALIMSAGVRDEEVAASLNRSLYSIHAKRTKIYRERRRAEAIAAQPERAG